MGSAYIWEICSVEMEDRIRNEEIHRIAGFSEHVTVRMKKNVLSWFGHVERMPKKFYDEKVSGERQYQRYWKRVT